MKPFRKSGLAIASLTLLITAACHKPANTLSNIQANETSKIWVFFDLGNTLVDTTDFAKQRYVKGAKAYLKSLRDAGFSIGLTLNIPEEWGTTVVGKFAEIVRFIDGRRQHLAPYAGWDDEIEFDWNDFDDNGVFFPLTNAERKPTPVLFLRALERAGRCGALFQGEDAEEVKTADNVGMASYQVGQAGRSFYMSIDDIKDAVRKKLSPESVKKCRVFQN